MLHRANFSSIRLNGPTGKLIQGVQDNWLLGLEARNPAILDMFRDRDVRPYRDLLPWSGEFAGKHITGAYYIWQLTRDQKLYDETIAFMNSLVACQDADGYLGCFSKACRLTGAYSQNPEKTGETWDSWGHYHAMFGLMLWHEVTGNANYWQAVLNMAELFLNTFYNGKPTLVSTGSSEMNLSVMHAFVLLYEKTGDARYLEFARNVEGDLPDPAAGDYMSYALSGMEFYQCPKPRWESLHVIMGLAEMYRATGEEKYLQATAQIFHSILKTDVHNTGGFSTREQAVGNPYESGAIETCCVLAYNALGSLLTEITGDLKIVEHLEKSHYNAMMGSFSLTGAWSTYDTPMDGTKKANYQDIVFQSRPGSPQLNCCSVNAPRGLGQVGDWAVMQDQDTLYINLYEPMDAVLSDGIKLTVTGGYPYGGNVSLRLGTNGRPVRLALRIPAWSKETAVSFRGTGRAVASGEYFIIEDAADEEITLSLDFSLHIEEGALDRAGKACVHMGPILFGMDASLNPSLNLEELPGWTKNELLSAKLSFAESGRVNLILPDGAILSDFYHLGQTGCLYHTWLPLNKPPFAARPKSSLSEGDGTAQP